MLMKDLPTVVKIKIAGFYFVIKAKFVKEVQGFPFDKKDTLMHNVFRISFSKDGGKTVSEKWYDSQYNHEHGVTHLTEKEAVQAFANFLDDGIAYGNCGRFEDFCSEFGYDSDSREAERIYKSCGKLYDKLMSAGFSDIQELCNVYNEANDLVNK